MVRHAGRAGGTAMVIMSKKRVAMREAGAPIAARATAAQTNSRRQAPSMQAMKRRLSPTNASPCSFGKRIERRRAPFAE